MLAVLAVAGDIDCKILVAQGMGDLLSQEAIVLDEKDFHAVSRAPVARSSSGRWLNAA